MSDVIAQLLGESFTPDMPFGENMSGDLIAGYSQGETIEFVPETQLGNGVQGPPQQQDLQIWRDNRPLAVDELGMEGPWVIPWVKTAKPSEGKTFPLNYEFGTRFDKTNPGRPAGDQTLVMSPFPTVTWADGAETVEVLPDSEGVYSTAGQGI